MFTAEEIAEALTAAGIPATLHGGFVRFQMTYGGRQDQFGLNEVTWGILHRTPRWLEPGQVEAEFDTDTCNWDVVCADVHPSDTMTIDESGRMYWSGKLRFTHYDEYFTGGDSVPQPPAPAR